jgi:hypothetical protein
MDRLLNILGKLNPDISNGLAITACVLGALAAIVYAALA